MPRIVTYYDNETGEELKGFYVRAKEAVDRGQGRYSFSPRKPKPPVSARDDKAAKASKAAPKKAPPADAPDETQNATEAAAE